MTCRVSTLRNMQVLMSVFSDSPQVLTFSFIFTQVRTLQCFLKGDLSHGKIQLLLMCCHNICDWLYTEPREAQLSFWPSSRTFFLLPYLHCVLSIYLPLWYTLSCSLTFKKIDQKKPHLKTSSSSSSSRHLSRCPEHAFPLSSFFVFAGHFPPAPCWPTGPDKNLTGPSADPVWKSYKWVTCLIWRKILCQVHFVTQVFPFFWAWDQN